MTALPGTIDKCKNCKSKKLQAMCPESCGIYQDLTADYEYERMKEDMEDEEDDQLDMVIVDRTVLFLARFFSWGCYVKQQPL